MKKPQQTPPFDVRKVIRAAMEAALEEPATPRVQPHKRRVGGGRAVILGAGLFTAGRLLVKARGHDLVGSVRDRVADLGVDLPGKAPAEPELDEEELLDEPEELLDEPEDLLDEEEEEPEPEDEEPDEDEEPEAEEDEDLEDQEPSNGSAPERKPRRQRRGR
jgi:outer membrane biosynthesis protein TonB